MEDVALFVREVDKEVRWLAKRPKSAPELRSHVASSLNLYGCLHVDTHNGWTTGQRIHQDEVDNRTVSEILHQKDEAHPELDVRTQPNRRKRKLVSYYTPVPCFGELSKDPIRLVGKTLNSFTALISSQARDPTALRALLGLPEPCQPFYFHGSFFAPRCKAWQCVAHQNKASLPSATSTSSEDRAYASIAWTKTEPMSTPPICSCREPTRVKKWILALQRAVEILHTPPPSSDGGISVEPIAVESIPVESPAIQSPRVTETPAVLDTPADLNTPAMVDTPSGAMVDSPKTTAPTLPPSSPAEELADLERSLLTEASNCKSCGGLCYFPFSFIEVFLNSHMTNLNEFQNVFPNLPPFTDVCCDGPHITATVCSKSPAHEWEIFQVLSQKEFSQPPIIYDICSQWFIPGVPTRPGQKRWNEKEVPLNPLGTPGESLLQPPSQRYLNCSKVVNAAPDMQTITSLAARRPYCIRVRSDVDVVSISRQLRESQTPKESPPATELISTLREHSVLSKKSAQLDQDLETLQMDALATAVCTPWLTMPAPTQQNSSVAS